MFKSNVSEIEIDIFTETLPEGLEGYIVNFDSIFKHKDIKEAFRKHLKSEYNEGILNKNN